ncbi:PQQ-binding-like beta-propeller repeat protein [Pajaroellobacter abortibovis]|uniref:Pyrrolo-quinoline quinone repeat domain-containing protein n=1 Tax=Pajaroellobacter abortibovis TaxID=1882918 RepID=A0A1L6MX68_9BACT|nr:PQQ-binding-like beta-propeller repeat protein [Pajaroellobacter abortibovis]APS00161.1 hypothetical protein BCY86_05300 [Pajaroellobacter abortibovis]
MRKKTLSILISWCIAGCNVHPRAYDYLNPDVPLWFHRPDGSMHVFLRHPITAAERKKGEEEERGQPAIDPRGNRIFVGSSDRGLYAVAASDGHVLWRFETVGLVRAEPLYDPVSDMVFFGSYDGALYAVRAQDGGLLWRFNTGAEVERKPVISGQTIYVVNGSDQLFAIDRKTGKSLWQVRRTPALGMEIARHAGPLVAQGKVFLAYSDGHVMAYSAQDGSEVWTPVDLSLDLERTGVNDPTRCLDVDTTPVIDPDFPENSPVFVASYGGGVYALNSNSGSRLWVNHHATGVTELMLWKERAHLPTSFGPERGGGVVSERKVLFAVSSMTGVWALHPETGAILWRAPAPEGGLSGMVSVAGALLIGAPRRGLFLLSPLNGKVIDGIHVGTGITQTPSVYGHRVFVMTNSGILLGIQVNPQLLAEHTAWTSNREQSF